MSQLGFELKILFFVFFVKGNSILQDGKKNKKFYSFNNKRINLEVLVLISPYQKYNYKQMHYNSDSTHYTFPS